MGQRRSAAAITRPSRRTAVGAGAGSADQPLSLSVFATELGWLGVVGKGETVMRTFVGHGSPDEVRSAARGALAGATTNEPLPERDWNPRLRRALESFARGNRVDFRHLAVDLGGLTAFRQKVLELTRRIPYGRTATYGELAQRAGKENAARAVGAAMASNPIPLIIPCHRVVASGGTIGGFSGPHGVELKRRLLELEGVMLKDR